MLVSRTACLKLKRGGTPLAADSHEMGLPGVFCSVRHNQVAYWDEKKHRLTKKASEKLVFCVAPN